MHAFRQACMCVYYHMLLCSTGIRIRMCHMCVWCRGRRLHCAHLCPGDGLHRAVMAAVGRAAAGSFLPCLHPHRQQEPLETGLCHCHLPSRAVHAHHQPVYAHRSAPLLAPLQNPPPLRTPLLPSWADCIYMHALLAIFTMSDDLQAFGSLLCGYGCWVPHTWSPLPCLLSILSF